MVSQHRMVLEAQIEALKKAHKAVDEVMLAEVLRLCDRLRVRLPSKQNLPTLLPTISIDNIRLTVLQSPAFFCYF